MNVQPGFLGGSCSWHLIEEAGEFLPAKDSAIINTRFHSLDEAGFLCPIVMPTLHSFPVCELRWACCVPPPYCPYVNFFFYDGCSRHSSTTECSIELILITSAYYWSV